MSAVYLREHLTYDQARIQILHEGKDSKDLYMKGICIQGGIKNANERIYPVHEISKAVKDFECDLDTFLKAKAALEDTGDLPM